MRQLTHLTELQRPIDWSSSVTSTSTVDFPGVKNLTCIDIYNRAHFNPAIYMYIVSNILLLNSVLGFKT